MASKIPDIGHRFRVAAQFVYSKHKFVALRQISRTLNGIQWCAHGRLKFQRLLTNSCSNLHVTHTNCIKLFEFQHSIDSGLSYRARNNGEIRDKSRAKHLINYRSIHCITNSSFELNKIANDQDGH